VLVTSVTARAFRNLDRLRLEPSPAITTVSGPNGAGKTNLLEALSFALTGRSFRTADRRELIAFGRGFARAEAEVGTEGAAHAFVASVSRTDGRRHLLDGAALEPARAGSVRPHLLVFSPDRLTLVKGPPAERRAELDRLLAALWPARSQLRQRYGQALAQRNALLGRVGAGIASPAELDAWDAALAAAAAPLIHARAEAARLLAGPFTAVAAELGLEPEPEIRYAPRAEGDADVIQAELERRRGGDLRLGRSSWGPHLDELALSAGARSVRRYASQGQQRVALLALLFAERDALIGAGTAPPLMLLDDVMSELDGERRASLATRLAAQGQALITATDVTPLPELAAGRQVRLRDGVLLGLAEAA
jgi:DNA replication and repair protein RecF